jgi:c-di-GMP-related signal transduction protein
MWPAIVVDGALIGDHKGISKNIGGGSISVQFFGTHDFARFVVLLSLKEILFVSITAQCVGHLFLIEVDFIFYLSSTRIKPKQAISFLKGLLSSFHLKCKQPRFTRSLEEAKM